MPIRRRERSLVPWWVFFLAAIVVGAVAAFWPSRVPRAGNGMDLEPSDCVEMCIRAIQKDRVFPNFADIVKECDERFGNGCKLD